MPNLKSFFTGSFVLAYLVVGSGQYIAKSYKPDGRRDTLAFASTVPRKVFRYSVVPGGVYTPEELATARRNDPVVAQHFADFGTNTRVTTLKEDMYVYVSYRKGDKIYYSKKKHKVCKGEVVLTDGKNFARTRCANRLTKIFRPPALAFDEPTAPQFDYVDPPASPEVTVPSDPFMASNYYGLPSGSAYPPPPAQQAQTGANPGPPTPGNGFYGGPSEVILPQLLPIGGLTPAFPVPLITTTPPVVTLTPEPAESPFLLASLVGLLFLFFGKRLRVA